MLYALCFEFNLPFTFEAWKFSKYLLVFTIEYFHFRHNSFILQQKKTIIRWRVSLFYVWFLHVHNKVWHGVWHTLRLARVQMSQLYQHLILNRFIFSEIKSFKFLSLIKFFLVLRSVVWIWSNAKCFRAKIRRYFLCYSQLYILEWYSYKCTEFRL